MDDLNDFPGRDRNHGLDEAADEAFRRAVGQSQVFIIQGCARKDYGVDYWLEVVGVDHATNVKIDIQLKGTDAAQNKDGSVSVSVRRVNLNYLLMQPHAIYVCYHAPSDSLFFRQAESVLRQYAHGGEEWTDQKSVTVTFSEVLTHDRLRMLADLAKATAVGTRDKRAAQLRAPLARVPDVLRRVQPDLQVPDNRLEAIELLERLYQDDAEEIISDAFDRFAAVLGTDHDAMTLCHMAEINLGMTGSGDPQKVSGAIGFLRSRLGRGRFEPSGLFYSIGNGHSALGQERAAVPHYEEALRLLEGQGRPDLEAQCRKNLGSSLQQLGQEDAAIEHYIRALELDPYLNEAHFALGSHHHRLGEYERALEHFDHVAFTDNRLGKQLAVSGWRVNIFFNLGDGKSAFREINRLLSDAKSEEWIWPSCARQVAMFGRASAENARLAAPFWARYLAVYPNDPDGVREFLLAKLYIRSHEGLAESFEAFKARFEQSIGVVRPAEAALLWDRLGHWAQDEDDWVQAEQCYRKAYDLDGGHYGYCLGTALNFLDRCEESLPLLLEQAQTLQPDDQSWFQVAIACERLDRTDESIAAYDKAIALNPDYGLAWFNLGGIYWNRGDWDLARTTWKTAVERFPDHELAAKLRSDLPMVLA